VDRVACVVGTRPEVIKMAPVVRALEAGGVLAPVLVGTGQHRALLDRALDDVGLRLQVDLSVMRASQDLSGVLTRVIDGLVPILRDLTPRAVLVQGDTTSVLGAALAAWHLRIPVGHIEAGLRSFDPSQPFPEEGNRAMVDRVATWLFAPTPGAAANLEREGLPPQRIEVTGNTAVDEILRSSALGNVVLPPGTILVTLHRRESLGDPLGEIVSGLLDFIDVCPEATALWPVHPNPGVKAVAEQVRHPRLSLVEPMGHRSFASALRSCAVVLTDSGGIQEEAPSLRVHCVVARDVTERPEAVASGWNLLAGRTRRGVAEALARAWSAPSRSSAHPMCNPYGDGRAGQRIARRIEKDCGAGSLA